jgi:pantoate--beta-alanine ligase
MRSRVTAWREQGERVGLVPTMGSLHEGHLSLIRLAARETDRVVVSLFVNPTQFGPGEDYESYPRDFERDAALCRAENVAALFAPPPEEMYAADASITIHEGRLADGLCGRSRPGHFDGVCTVVAKLFNIVQPHVAVFGEKDYQQLAILRRLVRDLDIPVQILAGPIVREADGLAMSSRNRYLSDADRKEALCLSEALGRARELWDEGERDVVRLRDAAGEIFAKHPSVTIDYMETVDPETLESVSGEVKQLVIAVAAQVGPARLIDNMVLGA